MNNNNSNYTNLTNTCEAKAPKTLFSRVLSSTAVGFGGILILPIAGILGFTFSLVGVGLPIISITNLLGLTYIPFNIGYTLITGIPQIIVAFIAGSIFLTLGVLSFKALKSFLRFAKHAIRG